MTNEKCLEDEGFEPPKIPSKHFTVDYRDILYSFVST